MESTYKRIIISRIDKIGDLILSIPSFFMVKKMYPNAEIVAMVRNYNYDIVKNLPYVDRVIVIDKYKKNDLLNKIKYYNADVFIALYADKYVMELAKASGAKVRIGPLSKLKSFFTFNKGVLQKRSKSKKNEAEYNLDLVRKLNKKLFDSKYEINTELYFDKSNEQAQKEFFEENNIGNRILVVNPFSGGSAKNLTSLQYANIIKKVAENFNESDLDIILTIHVNDERKGINMVRKIGKRNVFLFSNGGNLLNIGTIIKEATTYLGASTGPTHMAGFLQKEIVAIYPSKKTQSPTRWGVFNNAKVKYVIPDKNKRESYKTTEFKSYNETIENEIVESVVTSLRREN